MAHQGRQRLLKNGLTPKENKVKNLAVKSLLETGTMNYSEIGSQVYDTPNRQTASGIVREKLQKPLIKKTIEEIMEQQGSNADSILQNIGNLSRAIPEKVSAETILKANIEQLKFLGLYPGAKHGKSIKTTFKEYTFDEARKVFTGRETEATEFLSDNE